MNKGMNRLWLLIMAVCGMIVQAETLELTREHWSDPWPFHWEFSERGMRNVGAVGRQMYKEAPYSRSYEIEAMVTPHERLGKDWGSSGVVLVQDNRHFWYLGMVQAPDHMKRNTCMEMQECANGRWAYEGNYKRLNVFNEWFIWEYGKSYRLKLRLDNDVLTGSVEMPDGKLVWKKSYQLIHDEATRVVCPGVTGSALLMTYSDIRISHGEAVESPEQPVVRIAVPPYDGKSFVADIQEKATGFFYVKQLADGRWWAIDPLGRGFVPFGVDHCGYGGHFCEKLGYSPYGRHNEQTYKSPDEWGVETAGRLADWGFNLLSASVNPHMRRRGLAEANTIHIGDGMARLRGEYAISEPNGMPGSAFPNVFHPHFREFCQYQIQRRVAADVDNPWIFGWFIDNELNWAAGNAKTGLFNAVMKNQGKHSAKLALKAMLMAQVDGSLDRFNRLWGSRLASWDDFDSLKALPEETEEQVTAKMKFSELIAETYFKTISEEYRKVDSHHLLLGCRFAGVYSHNEFIWRAAGKYCDVVSVNFYGNVDLNTHKVTDYWPRGKTLAEMLEAPYAWCGKPMMMTEWSFPALDSGLPCTIGAGQRFRTQAERAEASSVYAKTLLSLPYMIGYDYFMWVDQPALGSAGGQIENSNYGLVNADGVPYAELASALKAVQRNAAFYRRNGPPPLKPYRIREVGQMHEDYTKALPTMTAWTGRCGAFSYEKRADGGFRLGNGKLLLENDGRNANLTVNLDGRRLGVYTMMLSYRNDQGQMRWTNAAQVQSFRVCGDEQQAVLEMTVRKPVATIEAKADAVSNKQFEMTYRLVLRPESDWFLADCVSVKNNMEDDKLHLIQVFFRLYADYDIQPNPESKVFLLWKADERSYWLSREEDGPYMGMCAMDYQNVVLRFWTGNETTDQHPDVFRSIGKLLRPGETWMPAAQPLYVFCYFGLGNEAQAKAHAERLRLMDLGK